MKKFILSLVVVVMMAGMAQAVTTLQVGAPGSTPGTYATYQTSLTNPIETDTAVTGGSTLYVAGAYAEKPELLLGGQYAGPPAGKNWSDFGYDPIFDAHRALIMATIPDGKLGANGTSLTINGINPFYSTGTYEDGFVVPNPPANHDPIKNQDYMFFDIGDFAKSVFIPDFADSTQPPPLSNQLGEIKPLTLATTGFDWIHFDAFALLTDERGNSTLVTTMAGNSGSHDVTWKDKDHGFEVVPEPSTLMLLGSGLIGLALWGRKKIRK